MHHTGFHILNARQPAIILHLIGFHILQCKTTLYCKCKVSCNLYCKCKTTLYCKWKKSIHISSIIQIWEDYSAYPYVQPSPPFGGGGGCFTANTMVWMSDSVPKEISKVAVGDMVYSWNFRLGKLERVSVIDVMEPRQSIAYKIELESGHDIEVTGGHPFCVEEQGWKVVSMEDYKKEVEDGNTWDSRRS